MLAVNLKEESMNKNQKEGCPLCECETCCKQIPLSAALTPEGADYVRHFCGVDCYEKWLKKQESQENN